MEKIFLKNGNQVEFTVVWSRRKTIAIYVLRNGDVEVRAPKRVSLKLIKRFVAEKEPWIKKQQLAWQSLPEPHKTEYHEGSTHYFLGEPHALYFSQIISDEAVIELSVRSREEKSVSNALDRWYRQQANVLFEERHDYWRTQLWDMDLPESEVALRKMKRRWGSCSRTGVITLNTHLVRYPMNCIDAVIVHELCHLLEFNHSRRFYQLMDHAYPHWKEADKMLKELAYQY